MGSQAQKAAGVTLEIGTKAVDPSGDTFTDIGEIVGIGEFGPQKPIIDVTALGDTAAFKLTGIPDNGSLRIDVSRAYQNAGQQAVVAAVNDTSDTAYNWKLTWNDQPSGGSNPTSVSFKAFAQAFTTSARGTNAVIAGTLTLAITGAITEVVAA